MCPLWQEEGGGGKEKLAALGAFDDLDACMMTHRETIDLPPGMQFSDPSLSAGPGAPNSAGISSVDLG